MLALSATVRHVAAMDRRHPLSNSWQRARGTTTNRDSPTGRPRGTAAGRCHGSRLPGPDAVEPSTMVSVSDAARFTAERVAVRDGCFIRP